MSEQIDLDTKRVYCAVLKVFNEVQKLTSFNKTQIFQLIKIFKKQPSPFAFSLNQVYLKIFKSCLDKTNKKIPTKYELLVETLFREIFDFADGWESNEETEEVLNLFNSFIALTNQAILSSVMNIRVMGAKITFLIVKQIPSKDLNKVMSYNNRRGFVASTINLLRQKITTYRQLGAKLASLAQKIDTPDVKTIEAQMLKIASLDQNEQIRKMVITNLLISQRNIDQVLIRLRDKSMDIRSIIIKKLQNENYIISPQRFSLSQIYKLLYDGFGSKQDSVKSQCLHYYSMYFEQNRENREKRQKNNKMQVQGANLQSALKPKKEIFNKFPNFVSLFSPEILLLNPHLYNLFDILVGQLIDKIPIELFVEYISDLLDRLKRLHDHPQSFTAPEISGISNQLIWIKHCSRVKHTDISSIYQEKSITGMQLGKMLIILVKNSQLYGVYQLLQIFQFELESIPDQYGRNEMFNSLHKVLSNIAYFSSVYHFKCSFDGISTQNVSKYKDQIHEDFMKVSREVLSETDDITKIPNHQELQTIRMMLSSYNAPIIASSFDLIPDIIAIMKNLRPIHYEIQVKQIISQLIGIGSQEKNDQRDIQLALEQIRRIQSQLNSDQMAKSKSRKSLENDKERTQKIVRLKYVTQRCIGLQETVKKDRQKIRNLILGLSKVSNKSHVKSFWVIIQENLKQKDQSNGLVLLALEALDEYDELEKYFQIFWMNFTNHQVQGDSEKQDTHGRSRKNSLLISIRAITDFIIKYDLLNSKKEFNFNFDRSTSAFSADILMKNLFKLLLHKDSDIKILSLETLCRLMYHEKIHNKEMRTIAFTYLLLLWWSTDGQESSAKSVHTISRFFKFYIDSSKENNIVKLAQGFCIFFKLIMNQMKSRKRVNKGKITYNLKLDQFLKKAIPIATVILKEKKDEDFTKKEYSSLNLKAQQLFILFLLSQRNFENYLQKPLQVCNFYDHSSLEVLILTKQILDKMEDQERKNIKNQSFLSRFEGVVQEEVQRRNEENYGIADLKIISEELTRKMGAFEEDLKLLMQHIEEQEIFVDDDNASDQSEQNENDEDQSNQSGQYPYRAESQKNKQRQASDSEHSEIQIPRSTNVAKKIPPIKKRGKAPVMQQEKIQRKLSPPPSNMRITRNRNKK